MLIITNTQTVDHDRTEEFREFAEKQAAGTIVMPPLLLPPEERRLYVRRTLREDHQFRIHNRPEGAQAKFDKLTKSLFTFFRGTALLYYRDYAGMDSELPFVLTNGDIHPENFGVMPNEDGAPFFGVNDFDEAYFAPFSYDVKRGAAGFYIAAWEEDFSQKDRNKVVRSFVNGYLNGLKAFARDDREKWHEFRIDNSPKMIRKLLEEAQRSRRDFLQEWIDPEKERFYATKEIVPHSKHIHTFQKIVDAYCENNDMERQRAVEDFFRVKDVAIKKDSGTASLGLDRYFVLIEGPSDDPYDDVVLEMKQTRRSALFGLVPELTTQDDGEAARVVNSHDIHLVGGDSYYGQVEIDGESFLVRERSPYKEEIDVDDLDEDEMQEYAKICGETLAQTHARSDEDTGILEGDAEARILSSIEPDIFCDDVARFARATAKRLKQDYKAFKRDHKLGAFRFVHSDLM